MAPEYGRSRGAASGSAGAAGVGSGLAAVAPTQKAAPQIRMAVTNDFMDVPLVDVLAAACTLRLSSIIGIRYNYTANGYFEIFHG
jgi:hypothetical protein